MGDEHRLQENITCHAWNAERTQLAVSPNSRQVLIYGVEGQDSSKWKLLWTLEEHDSYVSGIDWSPVTNLIVTCGHDRNAYVWKLDEEKNEWKPTLVILRINRAATSCRWSPDGNKFAVTSAAKCVPICHYEVSNDWWVSKMIKKHKSTVLCLDWHMNNKFIVTGGTDFKCRIFSAFIGEIDSLDDEEVFENIFADQFKFGSILAEFDCARGWIEAVSWSPSGFRVAFAAHDATISFVQILEGSEPQVQTVRYKDLPFRAVKFLSENAVVAAGHENQPVLFSASGDEAEPVWSLVKKLDEGEKKKETKKVSSFAKAKSMWGAMDSKGTSGGSGGKTKVKTRHQNQITDICPFFDGEETTAKFSTTGVDGRVLFWDLSSLSGVDLSKLGISS